MTCVYFVYYILFSLKLHFNPHTLISDREVEIFRTWSQLKSSIKTVYLERNKLIRIKGGGGSGSLSGQNVADSV